MRYQTKSGRHSDKCCMLTIAQNTEQLPNTPRRLESPAEAEVCPVAVSVAMLPYA